MADFSQRLLLRHLYLSAIHSAGLVLSYAVTSDGRTMASLGGFLLDLDRKLYSCHAEP